ncbi:LysR family transcriptional regulator [Nonomuraea sp. PA05]|uniref:LysR family transcriptional regulator n=1 Tax=Nonomuraea sp. PA05 TaxID=2604466 RepID=UPI0011D56845|nr:LysR family transcriptional regulator [Nonomuraea sp. PA05]TYB54162.1 LysR family transcriptional regulator [Nonomuraea sp. PA05]
METRELAYFAAVAEELHFGRAAARLGMAQPPLSRAIQKLERRLGVLLFERTSRGVSLTPAGEVLAREAAKVLDAVAAATARTRRAGLTEPRLVVALKPGGDGGLLPGVLAAYRARPGAVAVELALCGVAERARLVRDGTADVAFLHSPYEDLAGFDSEPLLVEGSVAVMTAAHPLAGREHVCLADLDAGPTPRWPATQPNATGPRPRRPATQPEVTEPRPRRPATQPNATGPRPRQPAPQPEVTEPATLMQLVALGRLVVVGPESVRDQVRRDLVCVPVLDAAPTTVVLAWPEGARSRALAEFVRTAAEVAAGFPGAVATFRDRSHRE